MTESTPPKFPFVTVYHEAQDRAAKLDCTPLEMLAVMQLEALAQLTTIAIEHYRLDRAELDRLDPRRKLWKPGTQ